MKEQLSKFATTVEDAQDAIDNSSLFEEKMLPATLFISEQNYSSISKEEFVKVLQVLFNSLGFKSVWSDFSTLWGSYQTDYGENRENMKDPEVLKKYLKDLAQEFIWINS